MRPEVWDDFQDRFGIPEIVEFYGATEGNGALINHCTERGARGAVGRLGYFLRKLRGIKIVKFDVTEELPVRDPLTGFCTECAHDEPGEMLIPISDSILMLVPGVDEVSTMAERKFRSSDLKMLSPDNGPSSSELDRLAISVLASL